jgi:hypothetical protein
MVLHRGLLTALHLGRRHWSVIAVYSRRPPSVPPSARQEVGLGHGGSLAAQRAPTPSPHWNGIFKVDTDLHNGGRLVGDGQRSSGCAYHLHGVSHVGFGRG